MEEFDDEYEIFEDGLESLIMDFEDVLDNCTQLDSSYYNREIDILQKITVERCVSKTRNSIADYT